jgi:glycosyltransferase involved in cell wall biosynthesis
VKKEKIIIIKKLISVVIPTHKRPEKLKCAIKSVLDQNYEFCEILVVNDDIIDEPVLQVINQFKDSRIKYLTNNRKKGPCGARNTGIINSKGDIIAFLDDDDIWLPERLNEINEVFLKHNVTGLLTGYIRSYKTKTKNVYLKNHKNFLEKYLADKFSLVCGSNLVLNKKIIKEIGLFDEELIRQEDTEYMVRYLSYYPVHIIKKPLLIVYVNESKPSPDLTIKTRKQFLIKIQNIIDDLDKRYKRIFYSNHYRRLALLYMQKGDTNSAIIYIKRAIKYQFFSPRKDVKLLLGFLKNAFKI